MHKTVFLSHKLPKLTLNFTMHILNHNETEK
jgi:hypothetical protein